MNETGSNLLTRGNARQWMFYDERDRALFVDLPGRSAQRFDAVVLCFVLMGNHFHLVAQRHRPNLGRWMQWLLLVIAVVDFA